MKFLDTIPFLTIFDDTALATLGNLPATSSYDDKIFKATTKAGDYLGRLQLLTSNSEKCKAGEFPTNHYALIQDQNFEDLGLSVDVAVLAWRPKAMDMSGDEVITTYDPESDASGNATGEFARIAAKSEEQNSNCMFGTEFLVWIPASKNFATFFMGTKSSRRESPAVKAQMRKFATLRSQKIETKKFSWFAPTCTPCSTPGELPSEEALIKEITRFNNPPKQVVERVEDSAVAEERAR